MARARVIVAHTTPTPGAHREHDSPRGGGPRPFDSLLQTLAISEQFDNDISQQRILTTLYGFKRAGTVAGGCGLYGEMAQSAVRRVRESGIRRALGARAGELLWRRWIR